MSRYLLGALGVGLVLLLLMGYIGTALTGWHKDSLGGPVLGIVAVLALVLGVGLAGVFRTLPMQAMRNATNDEPPKSR